MNQWSQGGSLSFRVTLLKSGAMNSGPQSMTMPLFDLCWRPTVYSFSQATSNLIGACNSVNITGTPNIVVASTCQFDTTAAPGAYNISANFNDVADTGTSGSQLATDFPFSINFKNCNGSPTPEINFSLYGSDTADPLGNFPLFSPNYNAINKASSNMGFQIIDKSAVPAKVLQASSGWDAITDRSAVNGVYPSGTNQVSWPFAVRLIKSTNGPLTLGTFEGRANFTVDYP